MMNQRHTAILIAILLPMLLFRWFAPTLAWQLDFWGLWFVAMVLVGLPLVYAEGAMAVRSQQTQLPVIGIQTLTRESDSSRGWRSFAWLSALLMIIVSVLGLDSAAQQVLDALAGLSIVVDIPVFALAAGFAVLAGILSLIGRKLLLPAVALVVMAVIVGVVMGVMHHTPNFELQMTQTSLTEWSVAVLMALVCVGAGTGLYWFAYPYDPDEKKPNMTKRVLPVWLMQLAVGTALLVISNVSITALHAQPPVVSLLFSVGVLLSAAFLIHYASTQLATAFKQFGIWIATLIMTFLTLGLVVIGSPATHVVVLAILSILCALELAIFSGWKMKISHVRKSLNFANETRYNIWRIAIRVIAPLGIILALIAIIMGWVSGWVS